MSSIPIKNPQEQLVPEVDHHGFPSGYFLIRSSATGRLLDVAQDRVVDGSPLLLWPEKETLLVEGLRKPEADNQVFFIDNSTGALCSKLAGHAIDVEDDGLVIRHRQPVRQPYPNRSSHPLPTFTFTPNTGQITVIFTVHPYFHSNDRLIQMHAPPGKEYILIALPRRRPPGLAENLGFMFAASRRSKPTADVLFDQELDLFGGEIIEDDMEEAFDVDDDDPDPMRQLRVVCVGSKSVGKERACRRRWEVVPLRDTNKVITGAT